MEQNKVLDISWGTILKIAVAFFCIYILFLIRDILVWIIFALIISVLFNPAIDFLKKYLTRVLATIFVYLLVFGILGFSLSSIAPLFVSEIQQFSQAFPEYFAKISPSLQGLGIEAFESLEKFSAAIQESLLKASANIFSALGTVFGGIFATLTIFSIALFISLEEKGAENMVRLLAPKKYEAFVLNLLVRSQKKVSGWFGARILCCIFVGLLTFVACFALDIKYAITFGFFAGVLNMIPIIGPVVTGFIVVVLVGLTSWPKALFFLVAFIIIQQIENNILGPVLTKRFIGLSPVLVLVAVMVGGKLLGIMGALLAIPLAGIMFEFVRDFLKKRKEEKAVVL
jgi:predicted PurR-regulated permease PerM